MKKYIPIAIVTFLFILAVLIFGKPILDIISNDNKVLVAFLIILGTGLLFSIILFYMVTYNQKKKEPKTKR